MFRQSTPERFFRSFFLRKNKDDEIVGSVSSDNLSLKRNMSTKSDSKVLENTLINDRNVQKMSKSENILPSTSEKPIPPRRIKRERYLLALKEQESAKTGIQNSDQILSDQKQEEILSKSVTSLNMNDKNENEAQIKLKTQSSNILESQKRITKGIFI